MTDVFHVFGFSLNLGADTRVIVVLNGIVTKGYFYLLQTSVGLCEGLSHGKETAAESLCCL